MIRVLVALELRTYREAIASALQHGRPQAAVSISEPEALDSQIRTVRPHVVLCGRSTRAVRDGGVLCWAKILTVDEDLRAVVSVKGGGSTIVPNIRLEALLWLIDQAEALVEADRQ
jgi:hypothetical protein